LNSEQASISKRTLGYRRTLPEKSVFSSQTTSFTKNFDVCVHRRTACAGKLGLKNITFRY